jgi:phosphoribosylanthranilate isomerase
MQIQRDHSMVRVKICGITNMDDALAAVDAGADALGFVFSDNSPRYIEPETAGEIIRALPPFVLTVGLFVNAELELVNSTALSCTLDRVQLHGEETPDFCRQVARPVVKVFRVKDAASIEPMKEYRVAGYLLDTWSPRAHGGTGTTFNWELAREAKQHGAIILAGGLNAGNVRQAVETVQPYGVDVSSGVEISPGKKDQDKVREFIRRAKSWKNNR